MESSITHTAQESLSPNHLVEESKEHTTAQAPDTAIIEEKKNQVPLKATL